MAHLAHCRFTSTSTSPVPPASRVMALPMMAPCERATSLAFIAWPGVSEVVSRSPGSMGPYVVLAFFAAQFVSWFNYSNLGKLIALEGVALLQRMALPTPLLLVGIILMTTVLNLFIGSASAKWALLSTIFVPVLAGVGISPELTQAAYRVGDSVTNSIAPLNPYMVIILVFMQRLQPNAGLGSLISMMLPYAVVFLIAWTAARNGAKEHALLAAEMAARTFAGDPAFPEELAFLRGVLAH